MYIIASENLSKRAGPNRPRLSPEPSPEKVQKEFGLQPTLIPPFLISKAATGAATPKLKMLGHFSTRRMDLGTRMENWVSSFSQQLLQGPAMLAMMGGALIYRFSRLAVLSRLLRPARLTCTGPIMADQLLANGLALGAESLAFTGIHRGANILLSNKLDPGKGTWGRELAGTLLLLGNLRFFGWGAGQLGIALNRKLPFGPRSQQALSQMAMYSGILTAHRLECRVGGAPVSKDENLWTGALATLAHFNAAGFMLRGVTPMGLKTLERYLDQESNRIIRPRLSSLKQRAELAISVFPLANIETGIAAAASGRFSALNPLKEYTIAMKEKARGLDPLPTTPISSKTLDPVKRSEEAATGEEIYSLDTSRQYNDDLNTLMGPQPSLSPQAGRLGFSPSRVQDLERLFETGGYVYQFSGKFLVVNRAGGADRQIASDGRAGDYAFYRYWRNYLGFPQIQNKRAVYRSWRKLQRRAEDLGIEINFKLKKGWNPLLPGGNRQGLELYGPQVIFIQKVLEVLPDLMLANSKLKAIRLSTEQVGEGLLSAFDEGEVYLYHGIFEGSRRNLAAMLLHELGHSTGIRYLPGPEGDPAIPEGVRRKMKWAHGVIRAHGAMIGLDHAGGPEYRKEYQAFFDEFLAENNLIYVAAGPKMRDHIRSIPEGTELREAWDFVYGEMRNRVFGGREYDYVPGE